MALAAKIKTLDDKIKAKQAQYDLGKETTTTSTLASGKLEKYEHLTGQDLGHKPGVVEQAKFEYSPLAESFNKALEEKDKKDGLLKKLHNIQDKNEEQLKEIEYQGEH